MNKKKSVGPRSRRDSRQDVGATLSGKLAPSQLNRVGGDIAATHAAIDELVYELYGLTVEERRIVN